MDRLTISYQQCHTAEEAYSIVRKKIPQILLKWNISADIQWEDPSLRVSAKGNGFAMEMSFEKAQALAAITLTFPLSVLKKTILPALEGEFKKHL